MVQSEINLDQKIDWFSDIELYLDPEMMDDGYY